MAINKIQNVSEELLPVAKQLQAEGFTLYTYNVEFAPHTEINSIYWFENGRVLNIQPSSWRNTRYNRDCFNLSVSYIPSHKHGSGCGLSPDGWGTSADSILNFRKYPTWVNGIWNYKDMEHFVKLAGLEFYEIESIS